VMDALKSCGVAWQIKYWSTFWRHWSAKVHSKVIHCEEWFGGCQVQHHKFVPGIILLNKEDLSSLCPFLTSLSSIVLAKAHSYVSLQYDSLVPWIRLRQRNLVVCKTSLFVFMLDELPLILLIFLSDPFWTSTKLFPWHPP
jgi:hypothetical protein